MKEELVVLVDKNDEVLGYEEKMAAHEKGLLHRAFSIFVFDLQGRLLLQKRAQRKYHSGGLWTNTCCSHPRPDEDIEAAAHRRLKEELGFDCPLTWAYSFIYRSELDKGLTEHEYDHVFFGTYEGQITPNPEEVGLCNYISLHEIERDIHLHPQRYTEWFKITFDQMKAHR
ncbi:isopentenyl-diphosphate Delta-isomerase [Olivibacter sitiensis]|uniref:isopentenyl-diphosphate Delta-isomerase n=1 Tax=Olivibacter sitiensis TaxID=376470 RepID=UPI0004289AD8|nr:isopentenyl-diphosphate Delta-isomerase [Olivibacter sitiensis]